MPLESITEFFSNVGNILMVVVGFGLIIFVHELGHFIFAKKVGAKVEKFSLGFGPRLFGFTLGETEYRVSLIPLGGYVKIKGLGASEEEDESPDDFEKKPIGQRCQVLVAGVLMNFLLAFPLCIAVFLLGRSVPDNTITGVAAGSPAFEAGLKPGDIVQSVIEGPQTSAEEITEEQWAAGKATSWERVNRILLLSDKKNSIFFKVDRNGQELKLRIPPLNGITDMMEHASAIGLRGGELKVKVADVPEKSVNQGILRPGDTIKSVDGVPIRNPIILHAMVLRACERPSGVLLPLWSSDPSAPPQGSQVQAIIERNGESVKTSCLTRVGRYSDPGIELYLKPVIGTVRAYSAAAEAGLRKGDRIVSVKFGTGMVGLGEEPREVHQVERWQDIENALGSYIVHHSRSPNGHGPSKILVTVSRGEDETVNINITPEHASEFLQTLAGKGVNEAVSFAAAILGIAPKPGLYVWDISRDSPLIRELGQTMHPGGLIARDDRVTAIDQIDLSSDRAVMTPWQVRMLLSSYYWIADDAGDADLSRHMVIVYGKGDRRDKNYKEYQVGISTPLVRYRSRMEFLPVTVLDKSNFRFEQEGLGGAVVQGLQKPFDFLALTYTSVALLISGGAKSDQLMGPVGILQISYESAESGLSEFLFLLALISINLAVLNILPIPVLDGGHLAFLAAEKIRGKPVSEKMRTRFEIAGLIIIAGLVIFATRNDIVRLLGL